MLENLLYMHKKMLLFIFFLVKTDFLKNRLTNQIKCDIII